MKKLLLAILALQLLSLVEAQQYSDNRDSLKLLLSKTKQDTTKVLVLADLSWGYALFQVDTSIGYAQRAIGLARQLNYKKGEAAGMSSYGWALWASGNYDKAIGMALKSLNLYKSLQSHEMIVPLYNQLAIIYRDAGDYQQALRYGFLSKKLSDSSGIPPSLIIGSIYLLTNQIDSASFYLTKAHEQYGNKISWLLYTLGDVEAKRKHYEQALNYYHLAIPISNNFDTVYTYNSIARLYQETGNIDSRFIIQKKY